MNFPGHSLTVFVKGTFLLVNGDTVAIAEEQEFGSGDQFYDDDEDELGEIRYEADAAYFKPNADIMLVGKCHTPDEQPMTECPVTLRVGDLARQIIVNGDRFWQRRGIGRARMTEPIPFTEMPLTWYNAYGGAKHKLNPVGEGAGVLKDEDTGDKLRPVPNLEDPASPIQKAGDKPEPACFAPVRRTWKLRTDKAGTYKGDYVKTRWPWFPVDFDWSYFNAASPWLQKPGYLRGDESVFLQNMVKGEPNLETRLPGFKLRCLIRDEAQTSDGEAEPRVREIDLLLDTLWIDAETKQLILTWRGNVPVVSEECDEVSHIFLAAEDLNTPQPFEHWKQQLLATLEAIENPPEDEAEEPKEPTDETEEIVHEDIPVPQEAEADEAIAKLRGGEPEAEEEVDLDNPPPMTPAEREAAVEALRKLKVDPSVIATFERESRAVAGGEAEPEEPWTRERVEENKKESFADQDLSGLDLSNMDLTKIDFQDANLEGANLSGATLVDAKLSNARLANATLDNADMTGAIAREADFTGATFSSTNLTDADLSGASLSDADLRQTVLAATLLENAHLDRLNLTGAKAAGVLASGANIREAKLAQSDLSDAVLAGADLTGASLAGATLARTDLTEAKLDDANFTRAALEETVFDTATMTRVRLDDAIAPAASFQGADLTDASLMRGQFAKARFDEATLERCKFTNADLTEASLRKASGPGADFFQANLTKMCGGPGMVFPGARFVQITAPDSIWQEATLDDADFSYARMQKADFTRASLQRAILYAADVRYGKFTKAKLQDARLEQMDLFEGSLKAADLSRGIVSGSNMYGADFTDTIIEGVRGDNANVNMTILTLV